MRIFLDANVWIAAILSPPGGSAEVLRKVKNRKDKLFISREVVYEVVRNLQLKATPKEVVLFFDLLVVLNLRFTNPTTKLTKEARTVINQKDALVLSASLNSKCNLFVTLDRRHFLKEEVMKFAYPLKIVLPAEALRILR